MHITLFRLVDVLLCAFAPCTFNVLINKFRRLSKPKLPVRFLTTLCTSTSSAFEAHFETVPAKRCLCAMVRCVSGQLDERFRWRLKRTQCSCKHLERSKVKQSLLKPANDDKKDISFQDLSCNGLSHICKWLREKEALRKLCVFFSIKYYWLFAKGFALNFGRTFVRWKLTILFWMVQKIAKNNSWKQSSSNLYQPYIATLPQRFLRWT